MKQEMNKDRFKFRVWDNLISRYWEEGTIQLGDDGQAFVLGIPDRTPEYLNDIIIEQCAGIRDKNGKLIYEGDIVSLYNLQTEMYNKCVVGWGYGILGFYCQSLENEHLNWIMFESGSQYIEIIGNIHENKGAK